MVTVMTTTSFVQSLAMRTFSGTRRTLMAVMTAALVAVIPSLAGAATRGPDSGGYTASDTTIYSFVDISGAGGGASTLTGSDDEAVALALPFAFSFYGHAYDTVCVSSNGAIYFVANATACSGIVDFANVDISTSTPGGDAPAAFPFWSDLTFQVPGAGAVFYQTLGAAGSRKFVVQWNDAFPSDSPNPVTFQAILFEGTNRILFQYKTVDLGDGNPATKGGAATIGVRAIDALASGEQLEWSFNAPVVANESALLFAHGGPATPIITWSNPADIVYGTALSATQLNATVNAPGTLSYSPAAGAPLNAGNGQPLVVSFTPSDPSSYAPATKTVVINVLKATPEITWASPAPITAGTALSGTQLNATSPVPGTKTYTPPAGTVLPAGNGQNLTVLLTPNDTANYTTATKTVTIDVTPGSGSTLAVRLLRPNGGEVAFIGIASPIRWLATGATSFDVLLSRNSGHTFAPIPGCTGLPANATSCNWTPQGKPTDDARVRVVARNGSDTRTDTSSFDFVITAAKPRVHIEEPDRNERLKIGEWETIRWDHNLGQRSRFRIELSRNGGSSWEVLAASIEDNWLPIATFRWHVTGPATTKALIRITWLDGPATDTNGAFSIQAPPPPPKHRRGDDDDHRDDHDRDDHDGRR